MAKVFIEESSLTAIGDAIRNKTGDSELMSPAEMATAIKGITTGVDLPQGSLVISGNCDYAFSSAIWDWYLYLDGVTTSNITSAESMFCYIHRSKHVTHVPFDINIVDGCNCESMFQFSQIVDIPNINGAIGDARFMFDQSREFKTVPDLTFDNSKAHDYYTMFGQCNPGLKSIGTLTNMRPSNMCSMFNLCTYLKELPRFVNLDTSDLTRCDGMFNKCFSLRSIPEELLKQLCATTTSYYQVILYNNFRECYTLDEIRGLNPQTTAAMTTGLFSSTFEKCYRLKDIIFLTQENGTPYSVSWKGQIIDLTNYIGYVADVDDILDSVVVYSGVTADKQVTDNTTYAALKNDPDWWTTDIAYSRYNHDSAVNTIDSLPDTSAYLAANGGTNTIKFKGIAGSSTDGGAINTLTEEEIAVAAAKGWTVTFA